MINPKLIKIRQSLDRTRIKNIDLAVRNEMKGIQFSSKVSTGDRVAVAVGSRGIVHISEITRTIINEVKRTGANPFIVPAMGSHGGATAEGQRDVLKEYGITESEMGVPIHSSMEVARIGDTESGMPVYIDKIAQEADHIIVINRIKPHTEYQGEIESGLMKMMVIGLGKQQGAKIAHEHAVKFGYERTITEIGQLILRNTPVTLGIAIIENGYGELAQLAAVPSTKFYEMEKELLKMARSKTPKIPFDEMDILIIDECGKEISGTGMDTKVVGRIMNIYELEVEQPRITRIILRDLTEKTHGNAIGIGLADFITKRVFDKVDYRTTYVNSVTAITPEKGRIPIVCSNDKDAMEFAIATVGPVESTTLKVVWIKNTSKLDEMYISQALLPEVKKNENLELIGEPFDMTYDENGDLVIP